MPKRTRKQRQTQPELSRLELEVMDVRKASDEEIAQGHVHGPGGVEH